MKNTLTVGELIDKLKTFNLEDGVVLYSIGFTSQGSYGIESDLKEEAVDKFEGKVRISFY